MDKEKLEDEKIEKMEQELMPFGFMDVGLDIEFSDDDGSVWRVADDDNQFL